MSHEERARELLAGFWRREDGTVLPTRGTEPRTLVEAIATALAEAEARGEAKGLEDAATVTFGTAQGAAAIAEHMAGGVREEWSRAEAMLLDLRDVLRARAAATRARERTGGGR